MGRGIQYRRSDHLYLVEFYDADGKLTRRLRRAEQRADRCHWRLPAAEPPAESVSVESADSVAANPLAPPPLVG